MEKYKSINEDVGNSISENGDDNEKSYRICVAIIQEEEGDYSALGLNLPGCVSCGETAEEALENFRESAQEVLASYIDAGEEIPWEPVKNECIPSGAILKQIIVQV